MKILVDNKTYNGRLDTCRACKHYVSGTRSCGPLIVGKVVKHRRNNVKLCGCIMDVKSRLAVASCPIGRWKDVDNQAGIVALTHDEKVQLFEFLNTVIQNNGSTSRQDTEKFWNWMDRVAGKKVKRTSCASCVQEMIESIRPELKQYIKQTQTANQINT